MSIWLVCPKCRSMTRREALSEAQNYALWHSTERVCPECVHRDILQSLLHRADPALYERVQTVWPLDAATAFGALPLPFRLHLDPQLTGNGVTMAVIDSGFSPHPDLAQPDNRIRAWIDATENPVGVWRFQDDHRPVWPGCDKAEDGQRRGLINSVLAAGNGHASHGFFRGPASQAALVLIHAGDATGRVSTVSLNRALNWVRDHAAEFAVKVVLVPAPDDGRSAAEEVQNGVTRAIEALAAAGVAVVAPAAKHGQRLAYWPSRMSPLLTVGSIDDGLEGDQHGNGEKSLFHTADLVTPSAAVAVPLLPAGPLAKRADELFARRLQHDQQAAHEISSNRLLNPHYEQDDARDFAAAVTAGIIASILQLNPSLDAADVLRILRETAWPLAGLGGTRQGAGVLQPPAAVARLLQELYPHVHFPYASIDEGIVFTFYRPHVRSVEIVGSWDDWHRPGTEAQQIEPGLWQIGPLPLDKGRYSYKFLINENTWIADPANATRKPDPFSGFESLLTLA